MSRYALISSLRAKEGCAEELMDILFDVAELLTAEKSCRQYIIYRQSSDPHVFWFSEVWNSQLDHDNAVFLPGFADLLRKAMPLMDGIPESGVVLEVLGGKGI